MARPGVNFAPVHTIEDVRAYNTVKIDNNPDGVVAALKKYGGHSIKGQVTRKGLGELLLMVYRQNKGEYLKILQSVPYNPNANNYTTGKELQSFMQKHFAELDKEGKLGLTGIKRTSNADGDTMKDYFQGFGMLINGSELKKEGE